jgi:hypothetical protein
VLGGVGCALFDLVELVSANAAQRALEISGKGVALVDITADRTYKLCHENYLQK